MDKYWYKPYDSPEELYVSWYLDELVEAEYVKEYQAQPTRYLLATPQKYAWYKALKTKDKWMSSTLLQEHVYTPDFKVIWAWGLGTFFKDTQSVGPDKDCCFWAECPIRNDEYPPYESILEVKPQFDRNNMTRLFTINQKWVYDKYGVYVQKIIPQKLFRDTFTPQRYLLTDSGKQKRKLIFAPKTLEEYVESRKG